MAEALFACAAIARENPRRTDQNLKMLSAAPLCNKEQ